MPRLRCLVSLPCGSSNSKGSLGDMSPGSVLRFCAPEHQQGTVSGAGWCCACIWEYVSKKKFTGTITINKNNEPTCSRRVLLPWPSLEELHADQTRRRRPGEQNSPSK